MRESLTLIDGSALIKLKELRLALTQLALVLLVIKLKLHNTTHILTQENPLMTHGDS